MSHIDEIRVDLEPAQRAHMMELTGRRTVPQIFIGDTHVGGCDDLIDLDRRGGLVPLLAAAPESCRLSGRAAGCACGAGR